MTSFVKHNRSFIHADHPAAIAQGKNELEVEEKLKCLLELSQYYKADRLKANPGKTVSCKFHWNKRKTSQTLELRWNDVKTERDAGLKNLGVALDRTLGFKQHCQNFVGKIFYKEPVVKAGIFEVGS